MRHKNPTPIEGYTSELSTRDSGLGTRDSGLPNGGRRRRGFTLLEILVVLAITAILMVIMFLPLSRSIELTQRAEAKSKGQDDVRIALRRITRELSIAMEVFEPRPIRLWGFNAWTISGKRGVPANGAVPEAYLANNVVIAMRLPKQQYYDTQNNHYVTPVDIDPNFGTGGASGLTSDNIALANCPRHAGAPVELRPVLPMEASDRITIYFVGLKNPGLRHSNGSPLYDNISYWGKTALAPGAPGYNTLNTYALYRVEFNPVTDLDVGNWNLPGGAPNPDFFYDTATAPNGLPYWQNWLNRTQTLMDSETADAVRWVEVGGKFLPHALCTFGPAPVEDAVAQPNRGVAANNLSGNETTPTQYVVDSGHWLAQWPAGGANDGTIPIPNGLFLGPFATGAVLLGPRVQVLDGSGAPVFDSTLPTPRDRLVSFDSVTGRIEFAFRRWAYGQTGAFSEHFAAPVDLSTYSTRLADPAIPPATAIDPQLDPNGMASSFQSARTTYGAGCMIVPNSEVIQIADTDANGMILSSHQLRRVGQTGLGAADLPVAQNDLDTYDYSIDYQTGEIQLANNPDAIQNWSAVSAGPGAGTKLLIKYRFQTNQPTDLVRVSYVTKELSAVSLGVVEYTRRNREALPFEVSERIQIRNLKR